MSQEDKKDKDKKSSSSKDKDNKLLTDMSRDPNQEVTDLVNKLGRRQAEALRKEFSQGQSAMKDEIKSLATVMADVAKTLDGLKNIPSIPGGSKEVLPHAPAPSQMFVNPSSPKITAPVLNFNLPRPGIDEMMYEEEEQEYGHEDDDEDDDVDQNLMDYVHKKKKKRVEPSMETVQLWGQYRKKTTDFRPDDWRIIGTLPNVKAYTDHPGAVMFKAPEVDPQAPTLKFKDKKDREKKLERLQTMAGAVGHISCEMIVDINTEIVRVMSTIQDFSDPAVTLEDARKEAADILTAIKDNVLIPMGLSAGAIAEVAGAAHNSLTLERRQPMVDLVMNEKNARTIVKRLQPSDKLLFGGHLAEVARDLKDSAHLNVLTGENGFKTKFKTNSIRGGEILANRGSYRGFRRGRGSFRGRAGQFGKKKN